MLSFNELILKRESCRNFNGKKVEKQTLEAIIGASRLAPSATNAQPWHFIVFNDDKTLKEAASSMQAFNQKAGAMIAIIEEKPDLMIKAGNIIKKQDYTTLDVGIVSSYITLAAADLNVSSCIIGWFNETDVKKVLNVSKHKRLRLIISLGYTDDMTPREKTRKPLNKIVTYIDPKE